MAKTSIEWSELTWNPTTGCTEVSPECKNCYARNHHKRLTGMGQKKYAKPFHEFVMHEDSLNYPFTEKTPSKIFVNSMSDLFHKDCKFDFIDMVFDTMMLARHHTYQILTKRPEQMAMYVDHWLDTSKWARDSDLNKELLKIPNHIWLGVSCGMQEFTSRIDILRSEIPASVKFVSAEPLLERVEANYIGIDQVIVGGESGGHCRPIQKEWVLQILEDARKSGTAFFFKQWGGFQKKKNGRILDGRTYDEMPVITA